MLESQLVILHKVMEGSTSWARKPQQDTRGKKESKGTSVQQLWSYPNSWQGKESDVLNYIYFLTHRKEIYGKAFF